MHLAEQPLVSDFFVDYSFFFYSL